MKKRLLSFAVLLFALLTLLSVPAFADTGPKPSVVVEFSGLRTNKCSVTLLSPKASMGPYWAYNGNNEKIGDSDSVEWKKFNDYKDKDGFYFLQYFGRLNKTKDNAFRWTYYPPDRFKILVYFPDSDTFAVSDGVYERYAFDSYFRVDASSLVPPVKNGSTFHAVKSYEYSAETGSFFIRVIITILLELLIAWLFGFTAKKQIKVIVVTNLITQTVLNLLLNYFNYTGGPFLFLANYLWMELAVFAIEAFVYCRMLPKRSNAPEKKQRPVLYAFTANLASFVAGILLAFLVPGVF